MTELLVSIAYDPGAGYIACGDQNVIDTKNNVLTYDDAFESPIEINIINSNMEGPYTRQCASLVNKDENRKVLFVELHDWENFYGKSKYKTGEYYVSACWDFAIRQNGFRVHRVSTRHYYEVMSIHQIKEYHLIFVRDPKEHRFYNDTQLFSKVRPMYFFGGWKFQKNSHNYRFQVPFPEHHIVTAYPDEESNNTFLGYFPHNILESKKIESINDSTAKRGKVGLLLGKSPEYFIGYDDLIQSLLNEGWELHSTCQDASHMPCPIPDGVIRHGSMKPEAFSRFMSSFSMMLGLQKPEGSPSPLIGLSYGVTFLNPLRDTNSRWVQHKLLTRLGFPYTYIVNLQDISSVIEAADRSVKYRFEAYTPPNFRVASLIDRMCDLLEDTS